MTFDKILPIVRAGGKARRGYWATLGTPWVLELVQPTLSGGGHLSALLAVDNGGGMLVPFAGANADLLADDWEVMGAP